MKIVESEHIYREITEKENSGEREHSQVKLQRRKIVGQRRKEGNISRPHGHDRIPL
jgi:hypothetical protein